MEPSTNRKKIVFIVALLAVAAIGAGIFYVYKGSLFRNPVPNQTTGNAATEKIKVILPKSTVSTAYYASYSSIVNGFYALERVHQNDMAPLILQIQTAITKKDSAGFTTLVAKAKSINDMQKVRIATLSVNFNNLAAANETLKDPTAKDLTVKFIAAGRNAVAIYSAYSKFVDDMVSGKLSAQSVTDAKTLEKDSPIATAAFRDASVKLTSYFNDTLATDLIDYLKAASSTNSKPR